MSDTRSQILAVAEARIREGGYHKCSFRQIASEIDIESDAIQHHFPGKPDLTAAVARRYTENFLSAIGDPFAAGPSPVERIRFFCDSFRSAYATSGLACLCGILSNEAALLPDSVKHEIKTFLDHTIDWLARALSNPGVESDPTATARARMIYSAMQGAMAAAHLNQDPTWIEDASFVVQQSVTTP